MKTLQSIKNENANAKDLTKDKIKENNNIIKENYNKYMYYKHKEFKGQCDFLNLYYITLIVSLTIVAILILCFG